MFLTFVSEDSCLILPDFSLETVQQFLRKCYLCEEDGYDGSQFQDLAFSLGLGGPFHLKDSSNSCLTENDPLKLTVSVNPSYINGQTMELSRLEKLISVNSSLSVTRGNTN